MMRGIGRDVESEREEDGDGWREQRVLFALVSIFPQGVVWLRG